MASDCVAEPISATVPAGQRLASASLHAANATRSTIRGVAQFLAFGLGYLIAFLCAATAPGCAAKLIGAVAVFFFASRLSLIGHDAGHGSLTTSARLNRWIGRLAFLPSYILFSVWVAGHNALHHAFTNLRGKDPLFAPLSKAEYDALTIVERLRERCYRTFFGVGLYSLVIHVNALFFPGPALLSHVPNRTALRLERFALAAFVALQIGITFVAQRLLAGTWDLPVAGLLAAIILPPLVFSWWSGFISFLHHTHPRVRWYADLEEWRRAQAGPDCAVHVVAPWPIDLLLGNVLDHTAHHVAPKLPYPELAECQEQLETSVPGVIETVNLFGCLRIFALCKLYDYENHRWLDFDGNPTTESN